MHNDRLIQLDGKRILLVDDEMEVRDTFRMVLEAAHAQVTVAKDGVEALELYRSSEFDCLVTDYSMPFMKGDALAIAVRAINPDQRVVMVSGFADRLRRDGALPWFLDALIPKPPARIADLLEAIVWDPATVRPPSSEPESTQLFP